MEFEGWLLEVGDRWLILGLVPQVELTWILTLVAYVVLTNLWARCLSEDIGVEALGPWLDEEALGPELCPVPLLASLTALALLGGGTSSFTALFLPG